MRTIKDEIKNRCKTMKNANPTVVENKRLRGCENRLNETWLEHSNIREYVSKFSRKRYKKNLSSYIIMTYSTTMGTKRSIQNYLYSRTMCMKSDNIIIQLPIDTISKYMVSSTEDHPLFRFLLPTVIQYYTSVQNLDHGWN